jgi:excisionase family DNA binding protein
MEATELLTVKEAAQLLHIAVSTLYVLISAGEIGTYKIKGAVRLCKKDLTEYLERHYRPALKRSNVRVSGISMLAGTVRATCPDLGRRIIYSRPRQDRMGVATGERGGKA